MLWLWWNFLCENGRDFWRNGERKVEHIEEVEPQYLIGADVSCLLNIGGRLQREGSKIKVMHIAEVLMQGEK